MDETIFISICIPAYKRVSFLSRLLDSIENQTYRHFEVIITDDSPDPAVFELTRQHAIGSKIRYVKNPLPLGTPENWNAAIRLADGQWIKLMHDDDWFAGPDALQFFVSALQHHPEAGFFFSAYSNIYLDKGSRSEVNISTRWLKRIQKNPKTLLSKNVIGPPSVIFHRKKPVVLYDPNLKWLVDIDFYVRFLQNDKPVFIPENLINVGMSSEQVTEQVFRNPKVEIPENMYLLDKIGIRSLSNCLVYDALWRFIRNLNIRSLSQLREAGYNEPVSDIIASMIKFQSIFHPSVLKTGPFSKLLMFTHYIFHYPKIKRA